MYRESEGADENNLGTNKMCREKFWQFLILSGVYREQQCGKRNSGCEFSSSVMQYRLGQNIKSALKFKGSTQHLTNRLCSS